MAKPPIADWEALKQEWLGLNVEGNVTLSEFADGKGLPRQTVANRASREGWAEALKVRQASKDLATQEALLQTHAKAQAVIAHQAEVSRIVVSNEAETRLRLANAAEVMIRLGLQRLLNADPEDLTIKEAALLVQAGLSEQRKALGLADRVDISLYREPEPLKEIDLAQKQAIGQQLLQRVMELKNKADDEK